MTEEVLDAENWKLEATAVINDVKDHVKTLTISEKLKSDNTHIYLNLITIEENCYCIQLSGRGFRVVGYNFDEIDQATDEYFETPYSLLNKLSPKFKDSFANDLFNRLNNLS
ncbi:unnamed protein product [Callosobruchus maculatus]|uniref:GSKIP domain-containing protein n=1 Tax=Callosobruchus maculatus TaxID=64391 RepID=A0A653BIF0_CALMS|nr:unnamed protein product [Callosobruchus maculatus]